MKKVKKAVIPAAGLGTRFLPATKTVPKELLPIVDTPIILYIVEEAIAAGVEDIVLVSGRGKSAIDDFFDKSYEVEDILIKAGKEDLLKKIQRLRDLANIISIRQKEALGLGHAVYVSRPVVGDEPFAVLLGDEITVGNPNVTKTLIQEYENSGHSSVAIMEVAQDEVSKYGIVDVETRNKNSFFIKNVVEKPTVQDAPSRWALPGRYVFDAEIYKYLENITPGRNGELQLTDGMNGLAKKNSLLGVTFTAKRYDAGDKLGYLIANIEFGLKHPELEVSLKNYIKNLAKGL